MNLGDKMWLGGNANKINAGRIKNSGVKSTVNIFRIFQVNDIEGALRLIKEKVTVAKRHQDQIRANEYRDRSIAEHNFERVNFWSVLQLLVMVIAGFVQVMLVRSLFDEKSYLYGLWKRIC